MITPIIIPTTRRVEVCPTCKQELKEEDKIDLTGGEILVMIGIIGIIITLLVTGSFLFMDILFDWTYSDQYTLLESIKKNFQETFEPFTRIF